MRNLLVGVLLPLLLWALILGLRISDRESFTLLSSSWWIWVLSLSFGSAMAGYGFRAYWWPCGRRRGILKRNDRSRDVPGHLPPPRVGRL